MKILLIIEPQRKDWYEYLRMDLSNEFLLLWHENKIDIPAWVLKDHFFKKVYYWNEFRTPAQLLDKVKPDRIVFFEIIDQRQIALMVTANNKGIKTFYLEHGAAGNRETAIQRANEKGYFIKTRGRYLFNRVKGSFGKMMRSKIFYYSAIFNNTDFSSWFKYLRLPFSMLFVSPNKALAKAIFKERTPFLSIVFNKPNFEQFQVYTGISEDRAIFSGVPLFDSYFQQNINVQNQITYIDHPYLEEQLLGWTPEYHRHIATVLSRFAEKNQIKLFVKLHPKSDLLLWRSYDLESTLFEVVQTGDFTKEMLSSKLILSYSSSMVNGFLCAKKNVVLLGWHPEPRIFGADFSKTGLCHVSFDPMELEEKYNYWYTHNLSIKNNQHYEDFLKEFNYPFDGKAGDRVIKAIMNPS